MRLLKLEDAGQLSLSIFGAGSEIPPYAILSHTWGEDTEEVTLQELMYDFGRKKAGEDTDNERYGYRKIRFCGEQARRDGLEYFWVDTCCIDKTNSVELSEAINSMFRWYRNAAKCYVYLADVETGTASQSGPSSQSWEEAFRESRWFTRGWTLQELIAPVSVEFFSSNKERLGDRKALQRQIHEITGIAIPALQGPIESSIEERWSWAKTRQTTCPEDGAYALLGIFDISMPLIYGEGAEKAFGRLQDEIFRADKRSRKRRLEELPLHASAKRLKSTQPCSIPSSSGSSRDMSNIDAATKNSLVDQLYFTKIDERLTSLTAAQGTTCRWFLTLPKYKEWQDVEQWESHRGFLWIKGNPGTGKSTLMKLLFEEAKTSTKNDSSKITLSFFFLARGDIEEKSTTGLYRSLLHQLFQKAPDIQSSSLEWMTVDGAKGIQCNGWNEEALKQTLSHAITKIGSRSLSIFVDALDECDQTQAADMISFFEELSDRARESQVMSEICFSSRHYPTIVIQKGLEITLEDEVGHTEDISQYIKSKLRLGKLKQAESFRSEILERSSRIFLWVVLVVDILNSEHQNGSSTTKIRARLKEIPPKLSDLFEMILTRYGDNIEQMQLCVKWILFASRPLKPQELYFAVQIGLESKSSGFWDKEDVDLEQMKTFVRSSSKGLAEVTRGKSCDVQFIHESVREFLLGRYESQWSGSSGNFAGDSHETLKNCCLAQLKVTINEHVNIPNPLPKASETLPLRNDIGLNFPFFEYSVSNVLQHANCAQQHAVDQRNFLSNFPLGEWIPFNNALERHDVRRYTESASMLYLLAERNLPNLIQICPGGKACFEVENERYGYPILAALATGSHNAIQVMIDIQADIWLQEPLLRHLCVQYSEKRSKQIGSDPRFTYSRKRGISSHLAEQGEHVLLSFLCPLGMLDIESMGGKKRRPLSYAAEKGHEKVVSLLLEKGAQIEAKDSNGFTPLLWAVKGGKEEVVKLLLKKGADLETKNNVGLTPLSLAAKEGKEGVVKFLLNEGAQLEAKDKDGLTPFLWAIRYGYEKIAKMLLEEGVQLEAKDTGGLTPLIWAVRYGREEMAKMLLEEGAQLEAKDTDGCTPFLWATRLGYEKTAKMLLEEGAQLEAKDEDGFTPLLWAARHGREETVKMLLEKGAQLEAKDEDGFTPLLWAARHGREETVKMLLEKGAQFEAKDTDGFTPLLWAASEGREGVVKLLLKKGAQLEAKDNEGFTPLLRAARHGRKMIAKMLLEEGAQLEDKNNKGLTPLSLAARFDYGEAVKMLLEEGAQLEAQDKSGFTPLSQAAGRLQRGTVKLLLESGAQLESRNMAGDTPLIEAVKACYAYGYAFYKYQETVIKLLLEAGADPEAKNNKGQTPLSLTQAADWPESEKEKLKKLLVEYCAKA